MPKAGRHWKRPQGILDLLLLIDHREHGDLLQAAYSAWNDIMFNEDATNPIGEPLRKLIATYKALRNQYPLPQIKPEYRPLSRMSVEEAKAVLDNAFLKTDGERRDPE